MKVFKKFCFVFLMLLAFLFAGCSMGEDDGTHKAIDKDKTIKIGILQIATHGALDESRKGFIKSLEEAGFKDGENIKITIMNPEGDSANLQLMAKDIVRKNDLVLAIATDAAKAVKTACENEGRKIPVLFTAVTDAVDAKLVKDNNNVGGRVTGTSDINPVKEQIALVKQMSKDIKTLGILYTINETNSKVQANMAKAQAEADGLNVKEGTVTGATDIVQVTRNLISSGAEVLYVPTDNNLAKNIGIVAQIANEEKIPVICGEINPVKEGGLITYGINYFELGKITGEMAVKIINGAQAKDLPVLGLPASKCDLAINMDTLRTIGFDMPKEILDKAVKIEK